MIIHLGLREKLFYITNCSLTNNLMVMNNISVGKKTTLHSYIMKIGAYVILPQPLATSLIMCASSKDSDRLWVCIDLSEHLLLAHGISTTIRTTTWENLIILYANKKRRRPACACVQSGQGLCHLLSGKYTSNWYIYYMLNFNILASLYSWADWFESHLFGNHKDRLSRAEVQIMSIQTTMVFFMKLN